MTLHLHWTVTLADGGAVLASDLTNGFGNGCYGNERVCDTVAWIKGCLLITVMGSS